MGTKSDIIKLPNIHLRQKSKNVGIINESVKKLIQNMSESILDWEDSREHEIGVALAGVQIDNPLKVVIIRNNFDNKNDRTYKVFINPEITKLEGEIVEDFEGCLSITDIYGKVPRYSKARIKALDINGQIIKLKAEGFLARIFQHEIDHTKGIVFIDHIKDLPNAFYKLNSEGQLEELNYDKEIRNSKTLWS